MFDHISLDIETLGTTADCMILSVGAVKFDIETGDIHNAGFYRKVSIESNKAWKRDFSADTLRWWMNQKDAARLEAFKMDAGKLDPAIIGVPLEEMLNNLSAWMGDIKHPNVYKVWGNGADFDQPFLQHAYKEAGVPVPWKFWDNRCLRTLKNLPVARSVKLERAGVHHNALDDAIHQANLVCAIWRLLPKK